MAGAGMVGGGPRGAQVFFTRQKTSKERLEIKWDYPEILKIERSADIGANETTTSYRMRALTREEAIANVANGDLRPLLVLRECETCKGSDDALLNDRVTNETTALYARWFHCVRLPSAVLRADHTFNKLFEGRVAPHMFVASHDGSNLVPLPGRPGQSQLWNAMLDVLGLEYERDAEQAAKEILKLLSHYDHLDSMEEEYENQLALEVEKRGPNSAKVRKLQRKIAELRKERDATMAKEAAIADLKLKRQGAASTDKSGG